MEKVKLGADPEFLIFDKNGEVIVASSVISGQRRLGVDGNHDIAELRPSPSENPEEVVGDIRRVLQRWWSNNPELAEYTWRAGAYGKSADGRAYPIGGHIHIGLAKWDKKYASLGTIVPLETNFVALLSLYCDTFLTPPVLLLEKRENLLSRLSCGYGKFSEVRGQPHGYEYRTLPSFICGVEVSKAVFGLARCVVQKAVNIFDTRSVEIAKSIQDTKSVHDADRKMSLLRYETFSQFGALLCPSTVSFKNFLRYELEQKQGEREGAFIKEISPTNEEYAHLQTLSNLHKKRFLLSELDMKEGWNLRSPLILLKDAPILPTVLDTFTFLEKELKRRKR